MDDDNSGSIEIEEFKNWFEKIDINKLNQTFRPLCPGELTSSQMIKQGVNTS